MKNNNLHQKRTLRAILIVLLLSTVGMTNALAQNFTVGDLNYTLNGNAATVTGHINSTAATGPLVVPESVTYNGTAYPVTSIGGYAFSGCSGLTSLTIGLSVTSIGESAFEYCHGLTSVSISNSVTSLGEMAFYCCGLLTSVTIGSSLNSITGNPFSNCTNLEQIVVDSDNIYYDSRENCNAIIKTSTNELVTGCKNTVIPNAVTSICGGAFYNCIGLTSIEIPNSVTTICSDAFVFCGNLTSVEIPNSVTSIGDRAFGGCSGLEQITIASDNTTYDSRENCNAIIKTNTNEMFLGCKNTVIPNSVISIGEAAFSGCSGLTSIEIPNSVITIGNSAFENCSGLTSIEIPNSVTSIGNMAFAWCRGLTSIEIPNSVTSISGGAFYNCIGLTSIEIPNSVTSLEMAFPFCGALEQLTVDPGNTVYDSRENCNAIIKSSTNEIIIGCKNTVIPSSVVSIGEIAFIECGLTSLTVLAVTPPSLHDNSFAGINKDIPVYVPCESMETYQSAAYWNEFTNFQEEWYNIVVSANMDEGGSVTGAGNYCLGSICTLTATANMGYTFVNWTENDMEVSSDATYSFTLTSDRNIVANFMLQESIVPVGAINGVFSINSNGDQVYFSQGNLQYQASTNTWQFAEHQWDYVGDGNTNASSTYEGWIDLFSWGTSGYDHGAVCYQPWSTGGQFDHAAYAHNEFDLCDGNGQADWGYNAISNGGNQEMQWRTCRASEWQYVLEGRETASGILFAKAVVNGINGLVVLPDNWDSANYGLNNTNDGDASYEVNVISIDDWADALEVNGAVFLPAAGNIQSWSENNFGTRGVYWSATGYAPWLKSLFDFQENYVHPWGAYYPDERYSVRLIRSASPVSNIEAMSDPVGCGTVTGAGICQNGQTCTLTATAAEGFTFLYWKENGKMIATENPYTFAVGFDRMLEACFLESSTYPLLYSFNEDNLTASVIGHWDGQNAVGDLVISETVLHLGESYTVTSIGSSAFQVCSGLTSVSIPNSVTEISYGAFAECSGLTEIVLPENLTTIGSTAFDGTSIASMIIPESVTSLGSQVFYGCGNLTAVTLPSGLTSIDYGLFQYCGQLASITIPAEVTWIDENAFLGCGLTCLTMLAEVPPMIHEQAFEAAHKLIPVYVPCGSLEAYQDAEGWNEFTNIIEMCLSQIIVTVNPAEGGTVTGVGNYQQGQTCTLTATANVGYSFVNWTEDDTVVSTDATYSFTVTGERSMVANFMPQGGAPTGALNGLFSINANGDQVYFSQGNLQYQASTDTWRFAENQWNYVGGVDYMSGITYGNVYENGVKCDNAHVTSSYEGWFDLFGWGTSGYDHGAVCYQPWSTSDNNSNYYAFGSSSSDLSGQADWGYNAISNGGNQNGQWRTLSKQEWEYVITERNTPSGIRFAKARVNGVYGVMVLPDDWDNSYYEVNNPNDGSASFTSNEISALTWSILESYGTLFLPKTGIRVEGGDYGYGECNGDYWSITVIDDYDASRLKFDYGYVGTEGWPQRRFNGRCVRLVRSVQTVSYSIEAVPNPAEGGTVTGAGTYNHGQTCTLTATANSGYTFVNWTKDEAQVSTNETYTFTVTEGGTYVANFGENAPDTYLVTVTANPTEGGTITGAGTYNYGETCTLTAMANEGYTFTNWTKEGVEVSIETIYSFTVTEGGDYMANFELNSYDITVEANPTEGGTVSGAGTYNHGQTCTLTATANSGYTFVNWTKDGVQVSTNETYTFTVNEGGTYVANFGENVPDTYLVTVTANPTEGGTITGTGTYNYGQTCTLTATANVGYTFTNWTKNGQTVSNGSIYSFTVTEAANYVANFEQNIYEITVTADPSDGGAITGAGTYNHGQTCTLTATANVGYSFVNWTEDDTVVSTDATYSFTVTGNRNLVANFMPQGGAPTGAINGLFSVGENTQVYFSQGNLQYQASTNTWRFAENQWDYVGSSNSNISQTYSGWIDLLGWGTSGWDSGNTYFHPWDSNNSDNTMYGPLGLHSLNGDYSNADWGVYNAISNGGNQANLWRILTHEEWSYVLYTRATSSGIRFVKAKVNDVIGIVLLPNDWSTSYYTLNDANQNGASFTSNVISASQWALLEQHGAVFLPAAGGRNGTWIGFTGFFGHYWTGEYYDNGHAWYVDFYDDSSLYGNTTLNVNAQISRSDGCSVRLVRSAQAITSYSIEAVPNPAEGGTVMGAGNYQQGQTCTLTATTNTGYTFLNWTMNGNVVSTSTTYSFVVTENATFVANFEENQPVTYTITATSNPANGGTVTGAGTYDYGETATLTATANEGYTFLNWTMNGEVVSTSDTYSFTVTEAASYVANFTLNSYEITVMANPTEGGTVTGAGTYDYSETVILMATANEGYTFTNWTKDGDVVSTDAIYTFTVTEEASFIAHFASSGNHWTYNPYQYPDNMTIMGIIQIEGVEQHSATLEVGAFCNGECRGTVRPTYMANLNRYILFFTIFGADGNTISFRLYDHATGLESDKICETTLTFETNAAFGDIINPYPLNFVEPGQTTNLVEGWNWWSSYVELDENSLTQLTEGLGENGQTIKSQSDGFASYLEGLGWYGPLTITGINNESSYQVRTTAACEVQLTGDAVNPAEHPITLGTGWSWIGYPVNATMSVRDAFSGITPQSGDMLKSQNDGYASYYEGIGWFGSLDTLNPGMGLMYKSFNDEAVTFTYPSGGSRADLKANQTAENNHWQPNLNAYADNMSVMAVVELDNVELNSENYELAAFANGECRGSVKLMYVAPMNRHIAFLTVAGDEATELYFGLFNIMTGEEIIGADQTANFSVNAVLGDFVEPYVVSFCSETGVDEWARSLNVFPNPVDKGQTFSLGNSETGAVGVEIINALGVVETLRATSLQTIAAPNVAGVYTLRITVEGKGVCYRKLVVR